jgi:hypothetical protein
MTMLRRLSARIGNAAGKLRGRVGGNRAGGGIRRAASAGAGRASGT